MNVFEFPQSEALARPKHFRRDGKDLAIATLLRPVGLRQVGMLGGHSSSPCPISRNVISRTRSLSPSRGEFRHGSLLEPPIRPQSGYPSGNFWRHSHAE